jgi:hypothetical protein
MRSGAALSAFLVCLLAVADAATAEVVRIDVQRRDDWGTHERIIGRVHFAIDPMAPANRGIADIDHAPRNSNGKVEFSSDLLFFKPKDARRARGTVFLEVVNRGRDQSLAILSGAQQRNLSPESWNLGDGFLLEQGFAVAFLGWQFDVRPLQGLTFTAPIAAVEGLVRDAHIELAHPGGVEVPLTYCVAESERTRCHAHVSHAHGRGAAADSARRMAAGCGRLLDARDLWARYRCVRGGLSREWFTACRSRSRRDPRFRVVPEVRGRGRPAYATRRPRSSG